MAGASEKPGAPLCTRGLISDPGVRCCSSQQGQPLGWAIAKWVMANAAASKRHCLVSWDCQSSRSRGMRRRNIGNCACDRFWQAHGAWHLHHRQYAPQPLGGNRPPLRYLDWQRIGSWSATGLERANCDATGRSCILPRPARTGGYWFSKLSNRTHCSCIASVLCACNAPDDQGNWSLEEYPAKAVRSGMHGQYRTAMSLTASCAFARCFQALAELLERPSFLDRCQIRAMLKLAAKQSGPPDNLPLDSGIGVRKYLARGTSEHDLRRQDYPRRRPALQGFHFGQQAGADAEELGKLQVAR